MLIRYYLDIIREKKRLIGYIYVGLMLLVYLSYVLLTHYRFSKGEYWLTVINLTQEDIQHMQQLGAWSSIIEVVFLGLMILLTILLLPILKSRKPLVIFLLLHLVLFSIIFLIGYALPFFTELPIGNLLQPLISAVLLLALIVIYTVVLKIGKGLVNVNKKLVSKIRD